MAMQHEVEHHRIAERLDRLGHGQLLLKRLGGTRQRGVQRFVAGLKTDLDMVQPGVGEGLQLLLGQADAGSDQVGVKPRSRAAAISSGRSLRTSGSPPENRAARCPSPAPGETPQSTARWSALFLRGKIERVGAIGALQRAAVGQLRQQPERRVHRRRACFSHGRSPILFVGALENSSTSSANPRRRESGRSAAR